MALSTSLEAPRPALPLPQNPVVVAAFAAIFLLGLVIAHSVSPWMALLFVTGAALGVVLYQALFGFTSAFRALLADRRSAGVSAQMVMLAMACLLFFTNVSNDSPAERAGLESGQVSAAVARSDKAAALPMRRGGTKLYVALRLE